MRNVYLILFCAVVITACNQKTVDVAGEKQALLNADKDFCATEMKDGMAAAMQKYYDADVVGIIPNGPVTVGKEAILKMIKDDHMDSMNALNWHTEKAVVSASGDLGYTWGRYEMKAKTKEGADTVYYGAYATFWKKEADGSWKAVLDQNDETPKP